MARRKYHTSNFMHDTDRKRVVTHIASMRDAIYEQHKRSFPLSYEQVLPLHWAPEERAAAELVKTRMLETSRVSYTLPVKVTFAPEACPPTAGNRGRIHLYDLFHDDSPIIPDTYDGTRYTLDLPWSDDPTTAQALRDLESWASHLANDVVWASWTDWLVMNLIDNCASVREMRYWLSCTPQLLHGAADEGAAGDSLRKLAAQCETFRNVEPTHMIRPSDRFKVEHVKAWITKGHLLLEALKRQPAHQHAPPVNFSRVSFEHDPVQAAQAA